MLEPAETEFSKKTNSKILSILMFIIVFVSMGQSVYWQTMPILGRELGFSEVQINSLISISAAMFIIFTPFWGRLSDRIGRKSVLIIGLSGYVISSLIFYLSCVDSVLVCLFLFLFFSGWCSVCSQWECLVSSMFFQWEYCCSWCEFSSFEFID